MEYRPILKLSDEVIGQIAAGEVVERPASAVKELVENSIDAGATAITIELKDGGISYIRVSDNGKGIPAGQIRMAFERHATSKLSTADDLFDVHTLGFRGEALASVAAVAKVTCTSRTMDAEYGVKAQVDAGTFVSISEAASPIGTTIVIKELFYNAPVRLKFLKKPVAEGGLVSDYIMRLILSRPDIAFRFVHQGKMVYRSTGDGTLESAIYCVYGKETLQAMRRVQGNLAGVLVEGFVGVGEQSRGNRIQQSFFINGRYFRDEHISKALENGCEGYVMIGRFPSCALFIQLPYRMVDVNVHPNKLEVRFQNPDAVRKAVEDLTREALRTVTMQEKLLAKPQDRGIIADQDVVEVLVMQPNSEDYIHTKANLAYSAYVDVDYNGTLQVDPTPNVLPQDTLPTKQEALLSKKHVDAEADNDLITTTFDTHTATPELRETLAITQDASELLYKLTDEHLISENFHQNGTNIKRSIPYEQHDAIMEELVDQALFMEFSVKNHPGSVTIAQDAQRDALLNITQERLPQVDDQIPLRYIGALFKTYLLFESGERLLMVDQHAAHERILYDRFMTRYQGAQISQTLLAPQMLRFTARDVALLSELQTELDDAGFDVELFDATSVAVRAIPVILGQNESIRELLIDVLDETQTSRVRLTRERLRKHVAQMACKHAIKAGDMLSTEDVRGLLEQMLLTGAQPTCPHGRPIITEMNKRELEKRFKRIQ